MTYKLAFNESALKEWKKLGHTIQEQFKKKLRERLENPRVPASQLHGRCLFSVKPVALYVPVLFYSSLPFILYD